MYLPSSCAPLNVYLRSRICFGWYQFAGNPSFWTPKFAHFGSVHLGVRGLVHRHLRIPAIDLAPLAKVLMPAVGNLARRALEYTAIGC